MRNNLKPLSDIFIRIYTYTHTLTLVFTDKVIDVNSARRKFTLLKVHFFHGSCVRITLKLTCWNPHRFSWTPRTQVMADWLLCQNNQKSSRENLPINRDSMSPTHGKTATSKTPSRFTTSIRWIRYHSFVIEIYSNRSFKCNTTRAMHITPRRQINPP